MKDELINKAKLLEDIEDAIDVENDGEDVEKSKFIILGLIIAKKYINKAATVEASPCEFCRYNGCGNPCIACPATAKGE